MFDTKTMKLTKTIDVGTTAAPDGILFDSFNDRVYIFSHPTKEAIVIDSKDGKILTTLPLAGGSDGAAFNSSTKEAFSTHGNGTLTVVKEKSPTSFEVEQNLATMNGARTITFDSKTNHIFTMSQERGPAAAPPAGGGRGPQGAPVPGSFTILMIGK